MAKITDPDQLNRNTEITFNTTNKTIQLSVAGNLSADGVTLQAVYSKCKELWRTADDLIPIAFPFIAITEEKFDMVNSWNWFDQSTKNLIRDAGWALKDTSNVSIEEWMGFKTLGTFVTSSDTVYYQQSASRSVTSSVYSGPVNEPVKIYSSSNFDYRDYFKCFLREQGKKYDASSTASIGKSTLTYQVYAFPLANSTDTKISVADSIISSSAPYASMSIAYYTGSVVRSIGGTNYHFNKIINGNSGTTTQIYAFTQFKLRQNEDIDTGSQYTSVNGKSADALLNFVGDTLVTAPGVYIDNFLVSDINSIQFYDTSSVSRTFPYVAAGTIAFNDVLTNDSSSIYKMYYTSVPSGSFGTTNAIIVNDNNGLPITASLNGSSSLAFSFDYDFNVQGGRTSGSDANITVVALGLNSAQYVKTTATITRTNANTVSLVSTLERNYSNA